jgi:O-acetyl-ADP-ribose deacetylase (regulator of RNase III)
VTIPLTDHESHVHHAAYLILEGRKMPIEFVSGDLFDNAHHGQAFAPGCNFQGSMGAGIAKIFQARYPEMHDEYRKRCRAEPHRFNLGGCWLWRRRSARH